MISYFLTGRFTVMGVEVGRPEVDSRGGQITYSSLTSAYRASKKYQDLLGMDFEGATLVQVTTHRFLERRLSSLRV